MDIILEQQEEKKHGKPCSNFVNTAYNFLFPDEWGNIKLRSEFTDYVNSRFDNLGCVVLWERGKNPFSSMIGKKEVIITSKSIRATDDYLLKTPMVI